jgi:ubiquitin
MALDEDIVVRLAGAPVLARAAMIARLQRSTGNAALARRLAAPMSVLARDEPDDPPRSLDVDPGASDTVALGGGGGRPAQAPAPVAPKRPAATTVTKSCDDCNAAAAILNSGGYVGEASVKATWTGVGEIKVTPADTTFVATVGIRWSIDAATSTMEVTDFAWPNMTGADNTAVSAFKAALMAHEEGHFTAVEAAIAVLPKTVTGTGGTKQEAVDALKAKLATQVADGEAAIDKATADYEAKTKNGKTQSAVGGTNVKLTCPPPPAAPAPKP